MSLTGIPIYCINLETSTERWENMKNRFDKEGIEVRRWNADTPETIIDCEYSFLNPKQKACASSHMKLWKYFLKEIKEEMIFILEDDAVFYKDWKSILEDFLKNHDSESWDAILLNVSESIEPLHSWEKVSNQYFTAGYILSRKGAEYLTETFKTKIYASDAMTAYMQYRQRSYSYFPWLIIQDESKSTIQENKDHDWFKVKRLLEEHHIPLSDYHF